MEEVKISKVYRHFKGNYYFVENIGYDCETAQRLVIYKTLYTNESKIWVRPEKNFLEQIDPNRKDNLTKQSHRFELVHTLNKDYRN